MAAYLRRCAELERQVKAEAQRLSLFDPALRQLRAALQAECEAALLADYPLSQVSRWGTACPHMLLEMDCCINPASWWEGRGGGAAGGAALRKEQLKPCCACAATPVLWLLLWAVVGQPAASANHDVGPLKQLCPRAPPHRCQVLLPTRSM